RAPLIEGTEWQGQVLAGEDRPMLLSVDDSAPRELQPAGGVVVQPLTFEHPDTYTIRLTAAFPCAAAELEVTIA
ncbi:MAG TPA: hypothetical protein VD902_09560, partial [Symbiobacteriaceae bacterium]|nr:hypothetical protein [Symbiobacteriaceae bacterium]